MAFPNLPSKSGAHSFSTSMFAKYFSLGEAWCLTTNHVLRPPRPPALPSPRLFRMIVGVWAGVPVDDNNILKDSLLLGGSPTGGCQEAAPGPDRSGFKSVFLYVG